MSDPTPAQPAPQSEPQPTPEQPVAYPAPPTGGYPVPQPGYPVPAPARPSNGLAVAGFVLGLLGFLGSFIPILNFGAVVLGVVGVILAAIGLVKAKSLGGSGKGLAVTGIILGVLSVIIMIIINVAVVNTVSDAIDDATKTTVTTPSATPEGETETGNDAPADAPTKEEASQGEAPEPLPFNASGLLGGDAAPTFDPGKPGEISVVQIGPLDKASGALVFAFRNNTPDIVTNIDWTATASDGDGLVGSGSSQGTTPSQVQPGEVGLAYIYFDNAKSIPKSAEYAFSVSSDPVDDTWASSVPLKVTEAKLVGGAIVGAAKNESGSDASGPFSVGIYCFKGDKLQSMELGYADQDDVADGGQATFSEDLYGDACPTFAVGVSGYSF